MMTFEAVIPYIKLRPHQFQSSSIDYSIYSKCLEKIDHVYNISYEQFFCNYMFLNKPCIISSNITENWKSKLEWVTDNGAPNFEHLEKEFGKSVVPVADCNSREYNAQIKQNMVLKDYLAYWKKLKSTENNSPSLYLKDWHFNREYPEYKAYRTPIYFSSDWLNEFCESESDDYEFVYMGPKGTWTPLHADVFGSYSWSANVCGQKKWLLFPSGTEKLLLDARNKIPYSVNEVELHQHCIPCMNVIQEPGEIIFVPSGWYHQVHNLEDSISINHNWFNGCNISHIWDCLHLAALDVEKEISDCKIYDDFQEQWQVLLKVHHGMNYANFHQILECILKSRLTQLQIEDFRAIDWHHIFDIVSISNVCSEMLAVELPLGIKEQVHNLESKIKNFLSVFSELGTCEQQSILKDFNKCSN